LWWSSENVPNRFCGKDWFLFLIFRLFITLLVELTKSKWLNEYYNKGNRRDFMSLIDRLIKPVYAHCDVPCGIYETDTMQHAADTCLRMIEKIESLEGADQEKSDAHNNFIRMVMTKEHHAQLCKDQIYVLWSDYFTPEHLQKFPDLHDRLWQAAKQCSKVKQTVSKQEAQKLVDMVHDLTHLFTDSKA
jgi:nickel superoxide dismutase